MQDMYSLKGKVAIVTGGNGGIGFSISKGLAQAGATVVIANRREAEGEKAAETLKRLGLKATAIPVDIAKVDSTSILIDKVVKDYGKLDIMVNNAAVIIRKQAENFTVEDWNVITDINLRGTFFGCQFAARQMMKQKKGKIINLSSVLSQMGQTGRSIYAISKAGISHMTRVLGMEWIKYGINVNALAPGITRTESNRVYFKNNPDEISKILSGVPAGRVASPEDYIGAAVFLASNVSDYMVGQTLIVDGGMTIP